MSGYPSPVHGRQCLGVVALTLAHLVTLLLCWATPPAPIVPVPGHMSRLLWAATWPDGLMQ